MRTTILVLVLCAATNWYGRRTRWRTWITSEFPRHPGRPRQRSKLSSFFITTAEPAIGSIPTSRPGWHRLPTDISYPTDSRPASHRVGAAGKIILRLEELGELESSHSEVYQEMHDHGMNLGEFRQLYSMGGSTGIDRNRLSRTLGIGSCRGHGPAGPRRDNRVWHQGYAVSRRGRKISDQRPPWPEVS